MPQKLGKGGHGQQNYVPPGDPAGGQYGDNETGSNKHFKVFKKPKETRSKELSKKQIKEIGEYVKSRMDSYTNDRMIQLLRYYSGSFGDLSGFTDQELSDIIDEFKELKTGDWVWYKKGSKWEKTNEIGLLEKAGIPYYDEKGKEEIEKAQNDKLIQKSQTEQDIKMQQLMGGNCTVCFGKDYDKDEVEKIYNDLKTITDDFPELKNNIRMIGDRNSLEKLINAQRQNRVLTEEEIQKEIEKIKKTTWFYGDNIEEKYRREAIQNLKGPIKISKLSSALAYWSSTYSALIYMAKMKNWDNSSSEHSFDVNWHSSNKPNGVMCHELGHSVHTSINKLYQQKLALLNSNWDKSVELKNENLTFEKTIRDLSNQNFNREYQEQYEKLLKEKYNVNANSNYYNRERAIAEADAKKELKQMGIKKYNLSEYATTNMKEFIAESFSAYYSGMNNPLANKVVEECKRYINYLRSI